MKCPHCHQENFDGTDKCINCGRPLGKEQTDDVFSKASKQSKSSGGKNVKKQKEQQVDTNAGPSKRTLLLGGLAVVLLLGLAIVAFTALSGGGGGGGGGSAGGGSVGTTQTAGGLSVTTTATVVDMNSQAITDQSNKEFFNKQGKFSDVKITDGKSAIEALNSIKKDAGFKNAKDEFKPQVQNSVDSITVYRVSQVMNGISVYGRSMVVSADGQGNALGVSGNYADVSAVNTKPKITKADAASVAASYEALKYGVQQNQVSSKTGDLTIFDFGTAPTLCWKVSVAGVGMSETVLVDAGSGKVVSASSNIYFAEEAVGQAGAKYMLPVDNGKKLFEDTKRNMSFYTIHYREILKDPNTGHLNPMTIRNPNDAPELISTNTKTDSKTNPKSAVDAWGNLIATFDFYKNVLKRTQYDGKETVNGKVATELPVYVNVTWGNNNAYFNPNSGGYIAFTVDSVSKGKNEFSKNLDWVAHEFTHGVSDTTWAFDAPGGADAEAISEAISDMMGEAVERNVTSNNDWTFAGKHWNGSVLSPMYKAERDYKHVDIAKAKQATEAHERCLLIDYAGYLIGSGLEVGGWKKSDTAFFPVEKDSKTGVDDFAKLWYLVQLTLPENATFQECATSAVNAASLLYLIKEISIPQRDVVSEAFNACGFPVAARKLSSAPYASAQQSATAIVLDVSDSMNDAAAGSAGKSKIEAAKEQGVAFVSSLESQSKLLRTEPQISISSFSDSARTPQVPTTKYQQASSAINDLSTQNMTNILAGVEEGISQLKGQSGDKLMVLLSDGMDTVGNSEGDILAAADEAKQAGIRIYTIGFGASGDLNEQLLQEIANRTGGMYNHEDPSSAVSASVGVFGSMMTAQLAATSQVLSSDSGTISQGQTSAPQSFEVTSTGTLQSVLYWPGSKLDLKLTDPDGTEVKQGYPGYTIQNGTIPTQVFIDNAKKGTWNLAVYGAETSMDNEPYYAVAAFKETSVEPTPTIEPTSTVTTVAAAPAASSDSTMLILLLVVVAIAAVGGVWVASRRKSGGGAEMITGSTNEGSSFSDDKKEE